MWKEKKKQNRKERKSVWGGDMRNNLRENTIKQIQSMTKQFLKMSQYFCLAEVMEDERLHL
jgi:hypothetical protein